MPKLNLQAKDETQKIIKEYLEEHVSDTLAEKINNGVLIQKDGKSLLNKKTLEGCIEFSAQEAQKLVEKGARAACIQDCVVFGWAIHYFEEDAIEGTLYNPDGTEYKPKTTVPPVSTSTTYTPPATKPKPQMSLFDLLEKDSSAQKQENVCENQSEEDEEPTEEELFEAANCDEEPPEEVCKATNYDEKPTEEPVDEIKPVIPAVENLGSPFYQRYKKMQDKYPNHIVAFRRGDFYKILGSNAELFAKEFSLTLTGRDCGLSERVPMVGFPLQAADTYLAKALGKGYKIAVIDTRDNVKLLEKEESAPDSPEKHRIDEQTYIDDDGVIHYAEDEALPYYPTAFDVEALCKLDELFGNEIEVR